MLFKIVIIKQLQREKKRKKAECTAHSVAKTNRKTESIKNYGEKQTYIDYAYREKQKMFFSSAVLVFGVLQFL